jgi:hypothetical protein
MGGTMNQDKIKEIIKNETWELRRDIKEIRNILREHCLYSTIHKHSHHLTLNLKLDKIEKKFRNLLIDCDNKNCPHWDRERVTCCECDPFECKKYHPRFYVKKEHVDAK